MTNNGQPVTSTGLGTKAMQPATKEPLGGTGGSTGGGTRAGEGEPDGANTDQSAIPLAARRERGGMMDDEVAAEAAALGSADGTLADRAGLAGGIATPGNPEIPGVTGDVDDVVQGTESERSHTTMGEALGTGAGRHVGSGTPPGHAGLGGAAPLGFEGGPGPKGTRSPGGDRRE
jgi:hypothetical protein